MGSIDRHELVSALNTAEHATEVLAALKAGILEKESPPQLFLKHAEGDLVAAAQRLAYYWEERAEVFNKDYLKPLHECLTDEHRKWLAMDAMMLLPGTDKEGRQVLLASSYQHGQDPIALCRFVIMHQLMIEQQEKDSNGFVLIRVADPSAQFDLKWAQRSKHVLQNCFPIQFQHIRIVCAGRKSHLQNTFLPMAIGGLGKDLGQRCKMHADTELTRMHSHLSDILEKHQLPVWLGGTWKRQDELHQQTTSSDDDDEELLMTIGDIVEKVVDADLEKEIRRILLVASDDSTPMEEKAIVRMADTIRARRNAERLKAKELENTVQLVFGVASLILEEMPGSSLTELLQDDLSNEIFLDLWASSLDSNGAATATLATVRDTSGSEDSVLSVVQALLQVYQQDASDSRSTDPVQETQVHELHSKFRCALKLLSLLQGKDSVDSALENKDQVAFVCELVNLPFPHDSKIDASQLQCNLDQLADKLAQGTLRLDDVTDIPDWLVKGITTAA